MDDDVALEDREIEPSPAYVKQLNVTPVPSPIASPKIVKAPLPSNPLDAAMFKQLFPEQPKVVVKKSLSAMQAECGSMSPVKTPVMTRRDSRTENAESTGLLLFSF